MYENIKMKFWFILFFPVCILWTAAPLFAFQSAPYGQPERTGFINDRSINEASGIAASRIHENILWTINDGGNDPLLYAVDITGNNRGTYRIKGAKNRDWEDIASWKTGETGYILIADVGDNNSNDRYSTLYILREPTIDPRNVSGKYEIRSKRSIRFRYEDGPRDCEAVAVDSKENRIYLISKRTVPPVLYSLHLYPQNSTRLQTALRVMALNTIPRPFPEDIFADPIFGKFSQQPTAMDISPDSKAIFVLTYKYAWLFYKKGEEDMGRVFSKKPAKLNLPNLEQAESACFGADGRNIFVTSEIIPAPIYRFRALRP